MNMNERLQPAFDKHPIALSIEDLVTFRMHRLVGIGDRAARHWLERDFGLSLNEWRMLALVHARAPCRAGDASDVLHMDKSQTSRLIKALQERSLIVNRPDPADGRAIILHLSEEGQRLYDRVFAEVLQANERILEPLTSDEVSLLHEVLQKLINHSQGLLNSRFSEPLRG